MSENGQPYPSRPSSYPQLGAGFCDATAISTGCRGRVSSGVARAAVTMLITSTVAAIDVLIVRLGVSSELLLYRRSTAGCSRSQVGCRLGPPQRDLISVTIITI